LKKVIKHKTYTNIQTHFQTDYTSEEIKIFQKTTEKKIGEYSTVEKSL